MYKYENESVHRTALIFFIWFQTCIMIFIVFASPAGEGNSEADKVAADGSAAVGSAMGMLTSLTSVVQSTVSRNIPLYLLEQREVFPLKKNSV